MTRKEARLEVIEQHLHCCEAEHYGCTQWGIDDVRWLIEEVKRLRVTANCRLNRLTFLAIKYNKYKVEQL